MSSGYVRDLLARLRELREAEGLSASEVEEQLILGPGWVSSFEAGEAKLDLSMLVAILGALGKDLTDVVEDLLPLEPSHQFERRISAEAEGSDLLIHFEYANYDAVHRLPDASVDEFDEVLMVLRDGLSRLDDLFANQGQAIKTDSVAQTFLKAVELWPHANPSDLWWFLVYRAYCDPYNHPAAFARMDFTQSWKRTGGWALEEVLVRHYGPFLKTHGINLLIAPSDVKERHLRGILASERLEPDKADVLLTADSDDGEVFFGVVHVKASFAERRTDDVPMSGALVRAGYVSPLWTMDCKSMPSSTPVNKGELGVTRTSGRDRRSAKRKDIEDDGYFSACFSYNSRTVSTPEGQDAAARIHVCDFQSPDDQFSEFIIGEWERFEAKRTE